MTPGDVITFARQLYNAVGDGFFSDNECYTLLYEAQKELALETTCIRKVYTTTTVINQQEYQKPTSSFSLKRVTYNGRKLYKVTDREDDALTLFNQTTTATGTPQYYWEWDTAIELRPVPDDTQTLKLYTYDLPQTVSASSSFDVPLRHHAKLANFLLRAFAAKDKNFDAANYYDDKWQKDKASALRTERKIIRGDAFSHVLDEETLPVTIIGAF